MKKIIKKVGQYRLEILIEPNLAAKIMSGIPILVTFIWDSNDPYYGHKKSYKQEIGVISWLHPSLRTYCELPDNSTIAACRAEMNATKENVEGIINIIVQEWGDFHQRLIEINEFIDKL